MQLFDFYEEHRMLYFRLISMLSMSFLEKREIILKVCNEVDSLKNKYCVEVRRDKKLLKEYKRKYNDIDKYFWEIYKIVEGYYRVRELFNHCENFYKYEDYIYNSLYAFTGVYGSKIIICEDWA